MTMPEQRTALYRLIQNPMQSVWRYRWSVLFSGLAIWWYSYSEISNDAVFFAQRWGTSVTTGLTFGVFFGLVVLLAAEIPERLHGVWIWPARLLLSASLGFLSGVLLWVLYMFLFLYYMPEQNDGMTLLVGGLGTAVAFALRATVRVPYVLAILWAAAALYLSLYLTWINFMPPLIYVRRNEHINDYALVMALLFALGAYLPRLVTEASVLLRGSR
jgi:hypothetical protein